MVRPARTGRLGEPEESLTDPVPAAPPPLDHRPVASRAGALKRSARRRPLRRSLRRSEYVGLLIGAAALTAVVMGLIGTRAYAPDLSFTDYLYRSLQLFVVYVETNGAVDPSHTPIALDIARFLAPAAAAAASIRAVLALFGQRATRAWVRYFVRDHVVICGLGPLGARLAIAFQEAGHRVVATEPDVTDAAVHECRAHGVIVLVGDATDRDLLLKAGIMRARYLVVASGDDGTNAEVALAAADAVSRRRRALPCFVHVGHPGLSGLLGDAALAAGTGGTLRPEFFNAWESVPPVLDEFPPGGAGAGAGAGASAGNVPHMLVVGPGRLGQALIAHAARRWANRSGPGGPRMLVTLVGRGATEAREDLAGRYPRLEEVCDLQAHDLRIESPDFERAAYVDREGVTSAYVAVEDEAAGLGAALTLSRLLPRLQVAVLTTQQSGLANLVSSMRQDSSRIALIDVLERSCRPEMLLNGTVERLARAMHRDYLRARMAAGEVVDESPSMRSWDELSDETKETNRSQAADVGRKLAAVGCRLQPWTEWAGYGFTFSPDEIERMAVMEHDRWCRQRAADGWTFGATRDDRRKTTPYLVPWDELTDDVKDYDRNAVQALPELLMYAGFEIVRIPSPAIER